MTDSLTKLFTKQLKNALLKEITFNESFTKLSKSIKIISSSDNKIKFYSWDVGLGGSWHHIYSLAQFKSEVGKIHVQQLNSNNEYETGEYTDCSTYQAYDILLNGKVIYLAINWGSRGSGAQLDVVQVFKIKKNKLVKCKLFFPKEELV